MVSRRWRAFVLAPAFMVASGMLTMATVSVGTAQASSYTTNVLGPISTQAACMAQAASFQDLPDSWAGPCRFEADYPGTSTPDPGWYFNVHFLITP